MSVCAQTNAVICVPVFASVNQEIEKNVSQDNTLTESEKKKLATKKKINQKRREIILVTMHHALHD